jgi:uncharacterized protein (TIGR03083 family)
VDDLERVWGSLDQLCTELSPDDWQRPTECPGWTVKDIVSHIVGVESLLLGRPVPDHEPAPAPHVRNELGRFNEVEVDYRRSRPPASLLEEFREVTSARLDVLRSLVPDDLGKDSWTPIGPGTVGDLLELRVVDCWVHEQDIRRAAGLPGHMDGPMVGRVLERLARNLGRIVAKAAGCPDGTAAVFVVPGRWGFTATVTVAGGRGSVTEGGHDAPTVRLQMDAETFVCLIAGRCTPQAELEEGRLEISGDEDSGRRIAENMGFMF